MRMARVVMEASAVLLGWPMFAVLCLGICIRIIVNRWPLISVNDPCGPVCVGLVAAIAFVAATLLTCFRDVLGEESVDWQVLLILCFCYCVAAYLIGGYLHEHVWAA